MVPNPLLGQGRPLVQGGAGGCPVYCRGSAQWVNRAHCSRGRRKHYPVLVLTHAQHGAHGRVSEALPAGRWEAHMLCRPSAIVQGLVQLDIKQETDHLMGPAQKPSPEIAGVRME